MLITLSHVIWLGLVLLYEWCRREYIIHIDFGRYPKTYNVEFCLRTIYSASSASIKGNDLDPIPHRDEKSRLCRFKLQVFLKRKDTGAMGEIIGS